MKRVSVLLIVFLVFFSCKSQYFKDFTYFTHFKNFESFYPIDSIKVISSYNNFENFRLFVTSYGITDTNAFLKIKLINKKIYYQLAKNADTSYQLMFDLNASVGDSFYIKIFYFENYFGFKGTTHNIHFDSFLCRIKKIDTINYFGTQRKTWKTTGHPPIQFDFIDSIGFINYGLTPIRTGLCELFNVCLHDSLVFKDSSKLPRQYFCDKDSFRKAYTSIERLNKQTKILIYPNPAGQSISINGLSSDNWAIFSLEIINCEGRIIPIAFEYINNIVRINVSSLSQGIYTILINKNMKIKFVKDM